MIKQLPLSSLLTPFFILIFVTPILTKVAFAQQYYFQDEFSESFLDGSKWQSFQNAGLITLGSDVVWLRSGHNKTFPFIHSKINPFPTEGDFSLEFKLQYTEATFWGTGVVISSETPINGQPIPNPLFQAWIWQDTTSGNPGFSLNFKEPNQQAQVIYSKLQTDLNPHIVRLEYIDNIYQVFLDDNLIYTSSKINIRPNVFWFGNPVNTGVFPNWNWTAFKLDYVRVKAIPPPQPFLDLPWDYQGKGLSFNEAALTINSYFDHEYPLLSSGLGDPPGTSNSVITYKGPPRTTDQYSLHDGYDYGKPAKVNMGDPVLAAADGTAILGDKEKCGACGNYILVDHGNGYQTRYYHMQANGLVVKTGEEIEVKKGQQIGKVGATGNVYPSGDAGAHIHFMVVQDKNKDGNFDDNLPDGITDPFGWQSREQDPWPNFEFKNNKGEVQWRGNKSFYLWLKKIDNLDATLTSNGGVFKTERYTLDFPQGATNQNLNLNIRSAPTAQPTNLLSSIGSTVLVTAQDALGNLVNQFQALFTITVNFSSFDLTRFKTNTISFYSSQDGVNWNKESTNVDLANSTATTQVDHLTHFALMAERADTIAPTTTANLSGDKGQPSWFRSDVQVALNASDNEGGLGVDYTMYRLPNEDWQIFENPLTFGNEGHHKIEFYSADNDENLENIKSLEFDIDKTLPEASVDANPKFIWPPDGRMVNINITGGGSDEHLKKINLVVDDEYDQYDLVKLENPNFSDSIQLPAKRNGSDLDGRLYIIKVVAEDLAGNKTEKQVQVIVPHDQR